MNPFKQLKEKYFSVCFYVLVFALVAVISYPLPANAARTAQRSFASPDEAVKALVEALRTDDSQTINAIFGPGAKDVVSSGDPVQDKAGRQEFLKLYDVKNSLVAESKSKVILQVGPDDWPFPVPVVKKVKKWSFDTKKGKQELINRRIGKNELSTIQTCLAYVDAQREYAMGDPDGDGIPDYAQKFVSTPGKKNGLHWEAKPGEPDSPFGNLFAQATKEGYKAGDKPIPYHGYYFKIL